MTARLAVNMATNVNPRFQRTKKGQIEIRRKSHVLTQSERLILVLADGESTYEVLRRKLGGIVERRFRLAIADLKAKGFIEERTTSAPGLNEVLDFATLENFVRQDPLDPVTITALKLQPQMLNMPPPTPPSSSSSSSDLGDLESSATLFVPVEAEIDTSRGVDIYLPLELQPVQNLSAARPTPMASELIMGNTNSMASSRIDTRSSPSSSGSSISSSKRERRAKRSRNIQIGYWLLFAGLVCVVLMIAAMRAR